MQEQEAFNAKMDVLEEERKNSSEENVKTTNDRNYQSYADYYDRVLDTVKEKQDDISKELEKGEQASRNNPFQIINSIDCFISRYMIYFILIWIWIKTFKFYHYNSMNTFGYIAIISC